MATPITWQNINAPSFSGVGATAASGADMLNRGLRQLNQLAQQQKQTSIANWDAGKQSNTDDLLLKIAQTHNMDQYNALQSQVPDLLKQYGSQVDRKAVMDALMNRDNQIRDDFTSTVNYQNLKTTEAEKPFAGEVMGLAMTDPTAAGKLLARFEQEGNIGADGAAKLRQAIRDSQFKLTDQRMQEGRYAMDQDTFQRNKTDYLERKAVEEQQRTLNDLISQRINTGDSLSDSLFGLQDAVAEYNRNNPNAPLRADLVEKAYADLRAQHGKRFGLTPEQQANMERDLGDIQSWGESQIAAVDKEIAKLDEWRNSKVPEVARLYNPAVSEGEVMMQIMEDINTRLDPDKEVGSDEVAIAVKNIKKAFKGVLEESGHKLPEGEQGIPTWLIREIIRRNGVDTEFLSFDKNDLDIDEKAAREIISNSGLIDDFIQWRKVDREYRTALFEQEAKKSEIAAQTKQAAREAEKAWLAANRLRQAARRSQQNP
jgi:hypothetical protein